MTTTATMIESPGADSSVVRTRTMYVNVDAANVRSGPTTRGSVIAKLKFLDPVATTGFVDGEWVEVEVSPETGMRYGWVHTSLISVSKEQAEAVKAAGE